VQEKLERLEVHILKNHWTPESGKIKVEKSKLV